MKKLIVLISIRKLNFLNRNLIISLNRCLPRHCEVLVNLNSDSKIDREECEMVFKTLDKVQCWITSDEKRSKVINSDLRGIGNCLSSDFVMFMDDDMIILDENHFNRTITTVLNYMYSHSGCSLARFRMFENDMSFELQLEQISSTSNSGGFIIRNDFRFMDKVTLGLSWKTDDYSLVLEAVRHGYAVDICNHATYHCFRTPAKDLTFRLDDLFHLTDPQVRSSVVNELLSDKYDSFDGNINYLSNYSVLRGMRDFLVDLLHTRSPKFNPTDLVQKGDGLSSVVTDSIVFVGKVDEYDSSIVDLVEALATHIENNLNPGDYPHAIIQVPSLIEPTFANYLKARLDLVYKESGSYLDYDKVRIIEEYDGSIEWMLTDNITLKLEGTPIPEVNAPYILTESDLEHVEELGLTRHFLLEGGILATKDNLLNDKGGILIPRKLDNTGEPVGKEIRLFNELNYVIQKF